MKCEACGNEMRWLGGVRNGHMHCDHCADRDLDKGYAVDPVNGATYHFNGRAQEVMGVRPMTITEKARCGICYCDDLIVQSRPCSVCISKRSKDAWDAGDD